MSAVSPSHNFEPNALTKQVASREATATNPAPGGVMRSIARRLARYFELSNREPNWTVWREVEALDRTPRL